MAPLIHNRHQQEKCCWLNAEQRLTETGYAAAPMRHLLWRNKYRKSRAGLSRPPRRISIISRNEIKRHTEARHSDGWATKPLRLLLHRTCLPCHRTKRACVTEQGGENCDAIGFAASSSMTKRQQLGVRSCVITRSLQSASIALGTALQAGR
jgi:hypothetical protein